jgi:MarR-like DNA-binding transcriptional regulator SgrR of sgrS sRNA
MPHVGRLFNYHGELTTSLYYQFDDSRLALCFRGDKVSIVNRLLSPLVDTLTQPRWYDFDPSRGKKLFERMSHRPSRVRLYSGHPALHGLARYFADILARDRCAVEVTPDRHLADLSIEFVPYRKNAPRPAMDTLLSLMVRDSLSGTPPGEYLRRIELELAQHRTSFSPAGSSRHLETVSRIMAEDLGLFPLFRPTLYIHTHKRLRNVVLTPDGRVDCDSAIKVWLQQPLSGVAR